MSGHPEDTPRRGYRFPAGVPAEINEQGHTFLCAAENLSRTGVLLVGPLPPPTGERVDLTLKASTGKLEVRIQGKVTRVEPDSEPGGLRIAVEFVDLDPAQRDAIGILLSRVIETPAPATSLESLKPGTPPHEVKKVLEGIPLPQRIGLAVRAAAKEREYLRLDQHPAVLDALVRNPGFQLEEARALAGSHFLSSGTVDALASDSRFNRDDEFKMLLASHPKVSLVTADKLTADLKKTLIRRFLARPGVNQLIRDRLLKRLLRD
jgi:PilZ domain